MKNNSSDFFNKQENYLLVLLMEFFRRPNADEEWHQAAIIAHKYFLRNFSSKANIIQKNIEFLSSKLQDGISPEALRSFAKECFLIAKKEGINKPQDTYNKNTNLSAEIKKNLQKYLHLGASKEEAISRAINDVIAAQKKQTAINFKKHKISSHPLRESLMPLLQKTQSIAKTDVKSHLLNLKNKPTAKNSGDGFLYGIMEKARSFSPFYLHTLMGDDLFFLCRPISFLDQQETILIAKVPTNSHQAIALFRTKEILSALKKDQAFRKIKSLRFKIKN